MAIIVPNREVVTRWLSENPVLSNLSTSTSDYATDLHRADLKLVIMRDLSRIGSAADLRPFEIPGNVFLETEKFSIENGKLTHSLK